MSLYISRALFFRIGLICWILCITYASLAPPSSIPKTGWLAFPHADKFVHFCMYFGLCFLLFYSIHVKKLTSLMFLSVLLSILYGSLMELAQGLFTENRTADLYDFLANSCGAISFILISKPISRFLGELVPSVVKQVS